LDDAIFSLKKKQQEALILYYLEGKTQKETAKSLGCSENAVKKRLAFGLEKLRHIFKGRGYKLSLAGVGAGLSTVATQPLTAASISTISKVAMAGVAAKTSATIGSITLAKGVLKAMFWAKVKIASVAIVATTLLSIATPGIIDQLTAEDKKEGPEKKKPSMSKKKIILSNSL